jgi:hypothetical protein
MRSPAVVVDGGTAVLYADVVDVALSEDNDYETFRMPITQIWVRLGDDWKCLSGQAGPRLI